MNSNPLNDCFPGSMWPAVDPASSMLVDVTQEDGCLTTITAGIGREGWTKDRRRMYPKEQWLALQPIIKRLYIDEGRTFPKVAEYLQEHHGFNPTKKQFLRRISQWGYEKNVKKDERREILGRLAGEIKNGDIEAKMLRGRRLDKAKLERWRKREGMGGSRNQMAPENFSGTVGDTTVAHDGEHSTAMQADLCQENVEEMSRPEEKQPETYVCQAWFNPWHAVDVVGSPGLTGLIGALTLDLAENIPDLDLSMTNSESEDEWILKTPESACKIAVSSEAQDSPTLYKSTCDLVSVSTNAVSKYSAKLKQHYIPGPLDELYPFPRSTSRGRIFMENVKTDHLLCGDSLKIKELECRTKFTALHNMGRSSMINLVNDMRSIAWRYFELNQNRLSEQWWRRVVTISLEIPRYSHLHILRACLWVVDNLRIQGKFKTALRLHRSIHDKIMKLLQPHHPLAMLSQQVLARILCLCGDFSSQLNILRELLRICLYRFGTRNSNTIEVLGSLVSALISSRLDEEAQVIATIFLQLDQEILSHADRIELDSSNCLYMIARMAGSLIRQRRYKESANVLGMAERRFSNLIRRQCSESWQYHSVKAELFKAEGRLLESEGMLRKLLMPHYRGDYGLCYTMSALADLIMQTGRYEEAVPYYEAAYWDSVKFLGVEHWSTKEECEALGYCYAHVGRFDDAIILFQQTKEKVAVSQDGGAAFRETYIEDIEDWICDIERMKKEAQEADD